MDIHKQANFERIRIQTTKGPLSAEQLTCLSNEDLNVLAIELDEEVNKSKKSFLSEKTSEDKLLKLKFDLVLDILNTKIENQKAAREALANKKHNQEIDTIIAEKIKDDMVNKKTIKQLEAMKK